MTGLPAGTAAQIHTRTGNALGLRCAARAQAPSTSTRTAREGRYARTAAAEGTFGSTVRKTSGSSVISSTRVVAALATGVGVLVSREASLVAGVEEEVVLPGWQ